jgi:hypothetical protein
MLIPALFGNVRYIAPTPPNTLDILVFFNFVNLYPHAFTFSPNSEGNSSVVDVLIRRSTDNVSFSSFRLDGILTPSESSSF